MKKEWGGGGIVEEKQETIISQKPMKKQVLRYKCIQSLIQQILLPPHALGCSVCWGYSQKQDKQESCSYRAWFLKNS